ncbi:MAG TPA: sigma 54-interacting transcriptional regulator [Polyangiaceae bacterium]|nr:sigma 54-interacting transcriptional regulator [Polyangiaceae bacterium]
MAKQFDGDSTKPSDNPSRQRASAPTLGIHWAFPDFRAPRALPTNRPITLGRGEECDVVLPGTEISRRHAELRRSGSTLSIRDLESVNGVFVRGVQLHESPLIEGDVVRLGEWVGVVAAIQDSDPTPPFARIAPNLLGGPTLARALELGLRAAKSNLPVLIQGETGTGKELTARAIHELSGRDGPFIGINCAALPEALAEGELFGYRRGAFTGAQAAHVGHFRAAQRGTLLLDELTDLSLPVQAKLLRVLEERRVVPLGESTPIALDVRVIAATQQPLADAVLEKRFRADLFARLDGLTIKLPPLKERPEDIGYLVHELVQKHAGGKAIAIDPLLIERLCLHDWPFNLRELDLLIRRLLVLHAHEPRLLLEHLPERVRDPLEAEAKSHRPGALSRDELELSQLVAQLRRHKGNLARAAAEIGISRQRAYRLVESRGDLELESFRNDPSKDVDKP